jgi:hypothetical protein
MSCYKQFVLVLLSCGAVFTAAPEARTLRVDQSTNAAAGQTFATIQSAIDAAAVGDTVEVAPGTYSGAGNRDLNSHGKDILVYSAGNPETTIIDCGGSAGSHHGGFMFNSGETVEAIVEGFTIKNAYFATDGGVDTGAIHCDGAAPFIIGCVISGNTSHGVTTKGPGLPSLFGCFISGNMGHGISMGSNQASRGGAIVSRSVIDHNRGVGVVMPYSPDSTLTVMNCTIANNDSGGVRFVAVPSDPGVVDTVYSFLYANIVAFNGISGLSKTAGFFPGLTIYCTDVFGQTANWQNVVDATTDTAQDFSADPKFCSAGSGGYYLLAGSPCLPGPGNPCFSLIGALGSGTCSCCVGSRGNADCSADQIVDISDLSRLIDHMFISLEPLCCNDEGNVDGSGGIDISDLSQLIDHMFISLNPLGSCP